MSGKIQYFCFFWILISVLKIRDTISISWPCSTNEDCNFPETAVCSPISQSCQCPAGFIFSERSLACTKAVPVGESCEDSAECAYMLSGAYCNNGSPRICECGENYTYIRGRCRLLNDLNGNCSEDIDCFFGYDRESVLCDKQIKKCRCAEGYYQRSQNICRRISMKDEPCIVNEDCSDKTTECVDQSCKTNNQSSAGRISREIGVQTDNINETSFIRTFTSNVVGSESKSDDSPSELSTTDETKDQKAYGDACEELQKPCQGLEHSMCLEGFCSCKPGYYEENKICMAELGENAEKEEYCQFTFNPQNKLCVCERNRYYGFSLRKCDKPTLILGGSCTQHSQCSHFGLAICNPEYPKICECLQYAKYDEKRELCIPKTGLGKYCVKSEDCSVLLLNSECSVNKLCTCKENYFERNGACVAGVNATCDSDENCVLDNSVCHNTITTTATYTTLATDPTTEFSDDPKEHKTEKLNTFEEALNEPQGFCQCKPGYVYSKINGYQCTKEATTLNDECMDDEQCKPLLGNLGKCVNQTCNCQEIHHLNYGKCNEKRALGETCESKSECFVSENPEKVECRNGVCQCKFGINHDIEKNFCIVPKKNSSGRPSPLKIITISLFAAAFLVTGAAIKNAYFV